MSKFNIEEKAKRYDKAIEKLHEIITMDNKLVNPKEIGEYLFPELYESEDEKIRKALISVLQSDFESDTTIHDISVGDIIAWLEKQRKQKTANEPRLKVEEGKWYVCISQFCNCIEGRVYKATSDNRIIDDFGTEYDMHNDAYKYFRPWTIKDAKDGDILWHSDSASNGIFIFKEIRNDGKILCYCDYDSEDHFCLGEYHTCCWINDRYIKPASKEQCDLLFQKMHEAGYEWDTDKKELKKIKQKPVEETSCDRCKNAQPSHSCQDIAELGRCYLEHEKQGEQKLIWDKFDDLMLKDAIEFIESGWSGNGKSHLIYWLKSIKDKFK